MTVPPVERALASLERLLQIARDDYADSLARLRAAWPDDPEEQRALSELLDVEEQAFAASNDHERL